MNDKTAPGAGDEAPSKPALTPYVAIGNAVFVRAADYDAKCAEVEALRELLTEARAPARELLWCMVVWNDHNFTYADLINKLRMARKALGLDGINRVDDANDRLDRIDAALAGEKS